MGGNQSSEKLYCNRYLNGHGPPTLERAAHIGPPVGSVQPPGQMTWVVLHRDLPGYPHDNTIQMSFTFPDGLQTPGHPHPGQPYPGQRLSAYLPDNREGRKMVSLMDKAFIQQLMFTVGPDMNGHDVVTPCIPLKTQQEGGTVMNGYPDDEYLKTVRRHLKEKVQE